MRFWFDVWGYYLIILYIPLFSLVYVTPKIGYQRHTTKKPFSNKNTKTHNTT